MNSTQVAEHRRVGSLRAQRALKAAAVNFDAPIDVFGAIENERVWLLFQPLDRLYGAYRRHDTPGIVIHAGHPHRLQRFTAAHELGHHLLGHDISVDAHEEVERMSVGLPAQEIAAQAFASTFIMPVQLINRSLSHLGLKRSPSSLSPQDAYRLSLSLGSSYTATVTQLRALDRITGDVARELLEATPIDIKTKLAAGHRPENARADVWPLNEADHGRRLAVSPDDELHLSLTESPATGYRWRPSPDTEELPIVGNEPISLDDDGVTYGAERLRHLWWRAVAPTEAALGAVLRRSFDPEDLEEHFAITVQVVPDRTGDAGRGVSRRQLQLL